MSGILSSFDFIISIFTSSWFLGIIVTGIIIWTANNVFDIPFNKKSGLMLYSGISLILYLMLNR